MATSPPVKAILAGVPSSPSFISLPPSSSSPGGSIGNGTGSIPSLPDISSYTREQLLSLIDDQRLQLHQRQSHIDRLMIEHASLRLSERRSRSSVQLQDTLNTSKRKSLEEITTSILTLVRNALEAERVALYFVSKDACFGIEPEDPLNYDDFRAHRFQVGSYVGGMVAANGRSIKIDDVGNDPRFDASWARRSKARCESTMCSAVRDHDGTVLAVIQALNKRPAPSIVSLPLASSPLSSPSTGPSLPSLPLLSTSPSSTLTQPVAPSLPSSLASSLPSSMSSGNISAADYKLNVAPLIPAPTINSTSKPGDTWHIFTQDDVDLLELMCMQLRSTMRRYLPYALLDYLSTNNVSSPSSSASSSSPNGSTTLAAATSGETGLRLRSFIDTYTSEPTSLKTRSMSDASRGRGLSFQWPISSDGGRRFNVEQLSSITFNVWEYSDNDLVTLTWRIFQDMGFVEEFHIPPASLQSFALTVCKKYKANPFHNWKHGFSVLQFTYLLLRKTNAAQLLLPEDVFSLIVSSLCHDVDHPGHNNTYEMATSSPLALTHNDIAVLENHHAHTTFLILRSDRCQLLSGMTAVQQKAVRACMIKAILATDMSTHFDEMKKIDAWPVPQSEKDKPLIDQKSDKERQFLVNTLIHSADLSGQVYSTGIARVWEDRITQEFINQVDLEAKHGLPSMPFMQGLDKPMNRAKQQVSFIEFVLQPWWRSVARMFPQLERCYKQLLANRDHFAAIAKGEAPYEPPPDYYKMKKEQEAKVAATSSSSSSSSSGGKSPQAHGRSPSSPALLLVDTYRVGGSDTGAPPINSSPRDNGSGHFSSTGSTPRNSNSSSEILLNRPSSGSDSLAIRTDESPTSRLSANGPSPSLASSLPSLIRPSSSSIGHTSSAPSPSPTHMSASSTPSSANGNGNGNAAGAPPSPLGLPGAATAAEAAVSTAAFIAMAVGHRPVLRSGESHSNSSYSNSNSGSGSAPATPSLSASSSLSPPPPKPRTTSLTSSPHSSTVTLTATAAATPTSGDNSTNSSNNTNNDAITPPTSGSSGGSPLQHTWTIHRKAPKTPGSALTSPTLPPLAENNEMAKRSGSTSGTNTNTNTNTSTRK